MLKHRNFKLKFANTLILIMFSACGFAQAESVNYVSLSAGLDDDSGKSFDAYADISLIEDLRLSFSHGENTAEVKKGDFTTEQNQIAFSGTRTQNDLSAFTWSLGYRTWGKEDFIETRDTNISVGYLFKNNWHVSVDYETGELELFIKKKFINRPASISSDRNAWRLTTSYTHDTGSAWISFLSRDYEKDLPSLKLKPVLRRSIRNIALSQAFALSEEEFTLGYEWLFDGLDFGVDYNQIISTVDNHRNQYASLYSKHYVGQNLLFNLRIEQELNNNFIMFTAGIGIVW